MPAPTIVVMGVSGCGKTTVGRALADARGAVFIDADDLHPPENVARMAAGVPLDDEARAPWLDAVAAAIAARTEAGDEVVVACSALTRSYRDRLRAAGPLRFVLLDAPEPVLRERLAERAGHFMPASLLADQLDTLERPGPDEPDAVVVDGSLPIAPSDALPTVLSRVLRTLGR
jgi:gluconokinase